MWTAASVLPASCSVRARRRPCDDDGFEDRRVLREQEERMARKISRRRFTRMMLAGGTAFGCALPARWAAGAAEYVFKWGTNVPESHPLNVHARKAAEAIKQETNGKFDLQLFPNNQLGGDSD